MHKKKEFLKSESNITFSFGQNWQDYLGTVTKIEIDSAKEDIERWLGIDTVLGKSILDVGSGSGIHSLAFYLLGANSIYSMDVDVNSVDATSILFKQAGSPENWNISIGSILDAKYIEKLDKYDIVYAWGSLHHTGALWKAIENSISLIKPRGTLWISIYSAGPRYEKDLALKKAYNSSTRLGKRLMIYQAIARRMISSIVHFRNPLKWNAKKGRGMNIYHDIVDWYGGLPYEVASEDKIIRFCRKKRLTAERIQVKNEGACSIYVFKYSR